MEINIGKVQRKLEDTEVSGQDIIRMIMENLRESRIFAKEYRKREKGYFALFLVLLGIDMWSELIGAGIGIDIAILVTTIVTVFGLLYNSHRSERWTGACASLKLLSAEIIATDTAHQVVEKIKKGFNLKHGVNADIKPATPKKSADKKPKSNAKRRSTKK